MEINNNTDIHPTWFLPYANPTATTSITNDNHYVNMNTSPIFERVMYLPHYSQNNVNVTVSNNNNNNNNNKHNYNYNLNGSNKINNLMNNKNRNVNIPVFNISNLQNNVNNNENNKLNTMEIKPHRVDKYYSIVDNIESNTDCNFGNERNYQKIYEHPFYQNMKPFLEQPFKHL